MKFTPEEIAAMAKEAGIEFEPVVMLCGDVVEFTDMQVSIVRMTRFAELVADKAAAREREACAEVCDEQHDRARTTTGAARAMFCAERIRARAQKGGV